MNLSYFKNKDNFYSSLQTLFADLNIPLNQIEEKPIAPQKALEKVFKEGHPAHQLMEDVFVLGQVDDKAFQNKKSIHYTKIDRKYDGLLIFGVSLKKREKNLLPSRGQLAEITRAFNREYPYTPVSIVFKYEGYLTLANAERLPYKQEWREGEKAGKVSMLRDIDIENPHSGHLRILQELQISRTDKAGVNSFAVLYAHWRSVFSVSLLNKQFYKELSDWYFWAMEKVSFPADEEADEKVRNATNLIRALTRLIFIWFLKEKGLVPDTLFDEKHLKQILKEFNKNKKSNSYYRAILQNLFFGTLNQLMLKRSFAKEVVPERMEKTNYGIKNIYRYAEDFSIGKEKIKELFGGIPFLNGGLFDCLDKEDERGRVRYIDGFSRNPKKQASVPDHLFFAQSGNANLNEIYGTTDKDYPVKGLIHIFRDYKFTVAENTPIEEEIALDPELLGRVFENLLASYNPETQTTARKQTGSFYTPREIVNYMVDESLAAYLEQKLAASGKKEQASEIRALISYSDTPHKFTEDETRLLIGAIDNAKILDPACGSGAFPMGILHKLVYILDKLDPENKFWLEQQRERLIGEKIIQLKADRRIVEEISDEKVRAQAVATIQKRLNEVEEILDPGLNELDYGRKLFLIENCIYGVDIQPIAVQIAKLRFFISLIIDQRVDPSAENSGIIPLPNLETKFVAANTLMGLGQSMFKDLFNEEMRLLEEELQAVRHSYFNAKTRTEKLENQKKDKAIRAKIKNLIMAEIDSCNKGVQSQIKTAFERIKYAKTPEGKKKIEAEIKKLEKKLIDTQESDDLASQLANWDPYDQNASSDFFDPEWMFGVSGGFDVVIGNPPYVEHKKLKDISSILKEFYSTYSGTADIYVYFYENGIKNLTKDGSLMFITSNKFIKTSYGKNLRKYFTNFQINEIIDFTEVHVFEALVASCIFSLSKRNSLDNKIKIAFANDSLFDFSNIAEFVKAKKFYLSQNNLSEKIWQLANESKLGLKEKIESDSITMENTASINIYRGVTTGYNPAFIIDKTKRKELIEKDKKNKEIIKPLLQGRNIRKWHYVNKDHTALLQTGYDLNIKKDYPEIYRLLSHFKPPLIRRADQGKNWWNLRACTYYLEFEKEKIIWGLTADKWAFAYDNNKHYLPSNGYILISEKIPIKYLLAVMNSKLMKFYFSFIGIMTAGGAFTLKYETISEFPIKLISKKDQKPFIALVDKILAITKADDYLQNHTKQAKVHSYEKQIDRLVYKLYGLTAEEIEIVEGG